MLRDTVGNRLFRKVQIKIIFPDNIFPPKVVYQHAEPHKGFGPAGLDDCLMQITDRLDTLYPWWDFKMTELTPIGRTMRYVFTFAGYRAGAFPEAKPEEFTNEHPNEESSALEPQVSEGTTPTEVGNAPAV